MMQEGPIDCSVMWGASLWVTDIKESELKTFKERYRIPNDNELLVPTPEEMACFPREGCVTVSEAILSGRMKLPLHLFLQVYP